MDLFDSATPEMKRIRNQRKDGSVLEQMKGTSVAVRPTEYVYNLDGEFQKIRDIFGPLSCETSPVSSQMKSKVLNTQQTRRLKQLQVRTNDIASPIRRTRRARTTRKATFADLSTNAPRLHKALKIDPDIATKGEPDQHDEDYKSIPSRKRAFGVFQDAASEISPAQTEMSLEEPTYVEFLQQYDPIYGSLMVALLLLTKDLGSTLRHLVFALSNRRAPSNTCHQPLWPRHPHYDSLGKRMYSH